MQSPIAIHVKAAAYTHKLRGQPNNFWGCCCLYLHVISLFLLNYFWKENGDSHMWESRKLTWRYIGSQNPQTSGKPWKIRSFRSLPLNMNAKKKIKNLALLQTDAVINITKKKMMINAITRLEGFLSSVNYCLYLCVDSECRAYRTRKHIWKHVYTDAGERPHVFGQHVILIKFLAHRVVGQYFSSFLHIFEFFVCSNTISESFFNRPCQKERNLA